MGKNCFIDKTSIISDKAIIGDNTNIWQFSVIMEDVIIGEKCNIGMNVFIEKGVRIGNNVTIKNNVSLYTGIIIEDDVFLGPSCVFTNVINPRSFISRKNEFKKTYIKKGVSIGANATILCGIVLYEYSFIGAGSVVTKDVKEYTCAIGNPLRELYKICRCGTKLNGIECSVCGSKYNRSQIGLDDE